MEYVEAKTILSKTNHGEYWFGGDYGMNLYRGCSHGCIYCDSRSNCYQIDNFDKIRVKKDALLILEKELRSKRKKGVVGIGAMSDSYNPLEKQLNLTRNALKLLDRYGFGVSIDTKSDLIVRDIDVFQSIQQHSDVIVKLTITCADDVLSKKIEPNVCPSSKRFAAIKQLSDAGIFCGVLFTPMLPMITDSEEHIKEMVRLSYEHGAKFIFSMFGVTLRENQRDYYYEQLDALFPGLSYRYRQGYRDSYMCNVAMSNRKRYIFETECKKYGLLYRMEDIIKAYKKDRTVKQMQLF